MKTKIKLEIIEINKFNILIQFKLVKLIKNCFMNH